MTPLRQVTGKAIPLGRDNIDTDLIIPAEHLKAITRSGLGRFAFKVMRTDPANVIDANIGAPILIAGANFGCGSSREHAAWALADLGIRAVIAPSYSDIFSGNAYKNGIATVVLDSAAVDQLLLRAEAGEPVAVDLEAMTVTAGNLHFTFAMDAFRRKCLIEGLDEIALTLASDDAISAYEAHAA